MGVAGKFKFKKIPSKFPPSPHFTERHLTDLLPQRKARFSRQFSHYFNSILMTISFKCIFTTFQVFVPNSWSSFYFFHSENFEKYFPVQKIKEFPLIRKAALKFSIINCHLNIEFKSEFIFRREFLWCFVKLFFIFWFGIKGIFSFLDCSEFPIIFWLIYLVTNLFTKKTAKNKNFPLLLNNQFFTVNLLGVHCNCNLHLKLLNFVFLECLI